MLTLSQNHSLFTPEHSEQRGEHSLNLSHSSIPGHSEWRENHYKPSYLFPSSPEPQVDVFQALPSAKGERKKVGLGSQMRK